MFRITVLAAVVGLALPSSVRGADRLMVAAFNVDASPPVGSPLAYDPTKELLIPLSCRGVILLGNGKPVVLCAVDWIGIGNDGNKLFRETLAKAAGTTPARVAVHALHQHDAPACDFSAAKLLDAQGVKGHRYDARFARAVINRAAKAVAEAIERAQPVTHLGLGQGRVDKVASNRRILGSDGKVKHVRWTATRDPKVRAFPAGTIDPMLKMVSFWNRDKPLVAITYYATHPQSYYRTGKANPDFPGIARNARQKTTGVLHVHFNGAGGNIGAGKWNDGSKKNRQVLADRVAAGMKRAWENTKKTPIAASDLRWATVNVVLPPAPHLDAKKLSAALKDAKATVAARTAAARNLIWLRRCKTRDTITIACLKLKTARVLHMPGELFVEYQLAAQKLRPDLFVAMAAYGDYAPGYIGTEIAYSQGGYETSPRASRVAPAVEGVLMRAVKKLLK
ncbi:MAG: hypothetical protein ACE5KM_00005 [Planctomycetaceae bacterium]